MARWGGRSRCNARVDDWARSNKWKASMKRRIQGIDKESKESGIWTVELRTRQLEKLCR